MAKYTFNVFTGELDAYENHFGTEGIYLTDSNGVQWELTVDTTGHLITTQVVVTPISDMIPLWFTLIPQ